MKNGEVIDAKISLVERFYLLFLSLFFILFIYRFIYWFTYLFIYLFIFFLGGRVLLGETLLNTQIGGISAESLSNVIQN